MVNKRGLGKGLDSMIPEKVDKTKLINKEIENIDNVSHETFIDINNIEPNRSQPRKKFEEDSLVELAESIKEYGIVQPLVLQKRENFYEIIAGERRWRAARIAGLNQIPAVIKDYTEQQMLEVSIIENIQREDLNPIEEALAYQKLIQEFNLKQDEVADRVSKSRTAITNTIRLLKLSGKVQQMLVDDIISGGHARALLPIEDEEKQYTIALKILDEKLSVREIEKLVKSLLSEPKVKSIKNRQVDDLFFKDLEEKMKVIIGTKVSINKKMNNKGKIEIEYYSKEELERLIDLLLSIEIR